MDLKEIGNTYYCKRHPWETARLAALQKILCLHIFEGIKVLDVGCGDGFISRGIFQSLRSKEITAVDIHLSDEMIRECNSGADGISFMREMPEEGNYELILLLDVIEHVENDREFLTDIIERYTSDKGKVMITVPAFQALFGRHDTFLGHYRRYSLQELETLAKACGLSVLFSGYLFFSLLLPKFVFYKLLETGNGSEGVGNWNRGPALTRFIEFVLNSENHLLIAASRLGITIPGLTGWVLCGKRG